MIKLRAIVFFFKFLTHDYSPEQFDPLYVKWNLSRLFRAGAGQWLDASSKGELRILSTRGQKLWFSLKNIVLFGSTQKRVEQVILYTLLTLTLEINNPLDRRVLNLFLKKR